MSNDPPRYLEAYPRISIGEALKSDRRKTPVILWRDQHDHAVGLAFTSWAEINVLIIDFRLHDLPYLDSAEGRAEIEIEYKGSTADNVRPYARCGGCDRHVDVLVYAEDRWGCKQCVRLTNRSTLIDTVVRLTERLKEIEAVIGAGRPRGMQMKKFDALEAEHRSLLSELGSRPRRSASVEYKPRLSSEWLAHTFFTEHWLGGER